MFKFAVMWLLLLLFPGSAKASIKLTAGALGPPTVSVPSTSVSAEFSCRSFGQTASDGGTLNIKYGTPMMCWATDSNVSGVTVNDNGWVPEVWFDWNWDDNSLGTVTRAGRTIDLSHSVGLVAAHAFKPSVYAESCNGGTNSLHTVALTVYSIVNGTRESDTSTMNVCVENPSTTWPAPVAYCGDSNCTDNPGVPAGAVHGGDTSVNLGTVLNSCDSTSRWIALEGGQTFTTTSTAITMGGSRCLIKSFGTGQAKLKFTGNSNSAAIFANSPNCAGIVFDNVMFANTGNDAKKVVAGDSNTGCYNIMDSSVSHVVGEEFGSIAIVDTPGNIGQDEGYFIKFTFDRIATGSPWQGAYIRGRYTAFVGGEISHINDVQSSEHNIRLPQWNYAVLDAMKFADPQWRQGGSPYFGQGRKELLTFRHDCNTTTPNAVCPSEPFAGVMALTRNELINYAAGTGSNLSNTFPVQWCTSGSGSNEPTKCYDVDVIDNVTTWITDGGEQDQCYKISGGGLSGTEQKRFRFFRNVCDMSAISGDQMFQFSGTPSDIAISGNIAINTFPNTSSQYSITNSSAPTVFNGNGCYENQSLTTCNVAPGLTEDATCNPGVISNPFSVTPGQFSSFDFTDVTIASGSAFDDKCTTPTPWPVDIVGNSCDSVYDVGPYCVP
jgi:hypothetical protein